jgi:hypothetical protein
MSPSVLPAETTGRTRVGSCLALVVVILAASACGSTAPPRQPPDLETARAFNRFPLYWVGERFAGLDLVAVDFDTAAFASLIYGTCEPEPDSEHASCLPPLVIQTRRICDILWGVERKGGLRIRGAPVGTQDGAPVLLTNRVQVKVYSYVPGLDRRVLRALRSLNDVPPVLAPGDKVPPATPDQLALRTKPCDSRPQ